MKRAFGLVLISTFLVSGCAFADWGWGHHDRYEYRGGHYWLGGAIVGGLVAGAILASLPERHDIVYVGGVQYWYDGTYYYQSTPNGYVVVQPVQPEIVVVQQPQYSHIQYQGVDYLVSNGRWFVQGVSGLIEVKDPTR